MNVDNLTINGEFTFGGCNGRKLFGILFNDASGSVSQVVVNGITENSGCEIGRAIMANGVAPRTLTITNTTVSDYNKNGIQAAGPVTMNVSASTIGPPASLAPGVIAQNGLVYQSGASGTTSDSVIYGSGFGNANGVSTAALGVRGEKRHLLEQHDHGRRN